MTAISKGYFYRFLPTNALPYHFFIAFVIKVIMWYNNY